MSETGELVRLAQGVLWVSGNGRVIVMNPGQQDATPLVLEASAAAIWIELAGVTSISPAMLVDNLARSFGVDRTIIHGDVEQLLTGLISRHLVVS